MEITNKNFKECLPRISEAINSAVFLAVDGEFTGIGMPKQNIHAFDTPETRYHKLRSGNMNFLMVQFGLAAFQYDQDADRYLAHTFNFYIFPRAHNRQAPDVRFTCQSSSIEFLVSQGFDFMKAFADGISYLSHQDEKRLLEQLQQRQTDRQSLIDSPATKKTPTAIPDDQKSFIGAIVRQVEEFCDGNADSVDLEPCNAFLRKLVYETIGSKFSSSVVMDTKMDANNQRYVKVSRVKDQAEFQRIQQEKCNEELTALDVAVGFSKVIKLITASGKLVVGHNMLLDVLHIINQFCFPLPSSFEEFKELAKCIFPRLLDTKHMASSEPFTGHLLHTSLGELQKSLEKPPFKKLVVETTEGFPAYDTANEKLHEAGYDAYITGLCFLSMSNHLVDKTSKAFLSLPASVTGCQIDPYVNKLHLMKVYDIPYVNLDGADISTQREHIFHISFAKEWKSSDISNLFSPFGGIQTVWLNESSALVGLYKKEQSSKVSKNLAFTAKDGSYKIITYQEYMRQNQANDSQNSQKTKRKLAASDQEQSTRSKSSRSTESMSSASTAVASEQEDAVNSKMELEDGSSNISRYSSDCAMAISPVEDIGEPVLKKTKSPSIVTAPKTTSNKLFDESQPW